MGDASGGEDVRRRPAGDVHLDRINIPKGWADGLYGNGGSNVDRDRRNGVTGGRCMRGTV